MYKNAKLNDLKESFASIFLSVINADAKINKKEVDFFQDFFKKEFNITQNEIEKLFENSMYSKRNIDEDIQLLKDAFAEDGVAKMRFMQYLNKCIFSDGIENNEYDVFEMIRAKLF